MSYLIIDDFRLGMDRRKQRVSGVPGALWSGINGHISRGGDFERRKKFVKKYSLPSGLTFGLAQVGQQLYVFGAGSTPAGMPAAVIYQQLASPTSSTIAAILYVTTYSSKLYAIAEFADGSIYHYYDGSRVTAWDTIATANGSNAAIAARLAAKISLDPRYVVSALASVVTIVAAIAGTAFTISASAVNGGSVNDQTLTAATPQANVAAAAETPSSFQITITGQNGGSSELYIGAYRYVGDVRWAGSNALTAGAFAAAINTAIINQFAFAPPPGTPTWTAEAVGNVVTVTAPAGLGSSANGTVFTADGTLILQTSSGAFGPAAYPFGTVIGVSAGGVDATAPVAQVSTLTVGGTFEALDAFTATIDGTAYKTLGQASGMGITALTYFGKVYSVVGSLLYFSAVAGPTDWSGTGSGFISIVNQDSESENLVGICQFQGRIAIYSRFNTQIWVLTVDPANNTFQQSVQNTGALSGRSLLQYGNIDTFYYGDLGIRSLRARDASNAPAVNDIGVAIDTFIQQFSDTLTGAQVARACATIEPRDGRYWLALSNRIFVLSDFPGSKITAWTYYDLTDEIGTNDITEMVRAGNRTWLRSGDDVFLYGGDDNNTYPQDAEIKATIALPFLSGNKPGTIKGVTGFDVGLTGIWDAFLQPNSDDDTQLIKIGTFGKSTYNLHDNPIENPSPLVAITMTCDKAGAATVSNIVIHFEVEDEK